MKQTKCTYVAVGIAAGYLADKAYQKSFKNASISTSMFTVGCDVTDDILGLRCVCVCVNGEVTLCVDMFVGRAVNWCVDVLITPPYEGLV